MREYKNLGAHRCKGKQQEDTHEDISNISTDPIINMPVIDNTGQHIGLTHGMGIVNRVLSSLKSKKQIEVKTPEELIEGLQSYKIPSRNPKECFMGKLRNKDKTFVQVVLVSELSEPKTFWAEKTGMNHIKMEDRMYKLPRDARGNVFFWHVDNKMPLIDTAHTTQDDADSSFHELQLANMYYSIGRAAGANDLLNNLKFILIIVGFSILLLLGVIAYLSSIDKHIGASNEQIMQSLVYLNESIHR